MKQTEAPYVQSNVVILASPDPHQDIVEDFMKKAKLHSRLMLFLLIESLVNLIIGGSFLWAYSAETLFNATLTTYLVLVILLFTYGYSRRKSVEPQPLATLRYLSLFLWLSGSGVICWAVHYFGNEEKLVLLVLLMVCCFMWWVFWAHYFHRYYIFLTLNNNVLKAMQGLIV